MLRAAAEAVLYSPGSMQTEARSPAAAGQKKTKPHPKTIGFDAASNNGDERVAFAANALIGHKVEVQIVSGTVYEGILHSLQARNKQPNVVLYHAKPIKGPEASAQARPVKELVIKPEDLVQILAAGVDLSPEALAGPTNGAAAFGTDSEISRGRGGYAYFPTQLSASRIGVSLHSRHRLDAFGLQVTA